MSSAATQSSDTPHILDVDVASFEHEVLGRSHEVGVVVDFWADWCGPCRTLTPLLEAAVTARAGEVVLAKIDVDANPQLAQRFQVQGIPQVLGFRDGKVVDQFTGVVGEDKIAAFLDALAPSDADRAVAQAQTGEPQDARRHLQAALEIEPDHRPARLRLAALIADEDPGQALELVRPLRPDPEAEAVVTRARLARDSGDVATLRAKVAEGGSQPEDLLELGRALAAAGEYGEAIDALLQTVIGGGDNREPAREQLVALFQLLGDADPRVQAARPRLARALY